VTTALTCADLYEFDPEQTRRPPYRVRVRTTLPFLGARFESVRTITISDAVPGVSCRHTLTGYVRVRGPGGEGGTRAPTVFASCISAGHGRRGAVWGADAQQLEATAVWALLGDLHHVRLPVPLSVSTSSWAGFAQLSGMQRM